MTPYLSLLSKALTASLYPESSWLLLRPGRTGLYGKLRDFVLQQMSQKNYLLIKRLPFDEAKRAAGEDWPMFGYSMVGAKRLENILACLKSVVEENIEGDFVECGVWRGGASIFARATLNELGATNRLVWLADSFEGMPVQKNEDLDDPALAGHQYLMVSLDDVRKNFETFGLSISNVRFLKGWFSDTLAKSEIEKISVLRLDGDYYSSTMDALDALYSRVSVGGYIIIDDFHAFVTCKRAVEDFCSKQNISPKLVDIDRFAIYWRKELDLSHNSKVMGEVGS